MTRADEALISDLILQDEQAVQALIDRYWSRAYRFALPVVGGDPAGAEDVVQEAFLAVLRKADRFDASRGAFRSWFFRIVHNTARNHLRSSRRRSQREAAVKPREVRDDHAGVALEELGRLEPDLRWAVTLKCIEGMTFKEVADTLGWPEGTAATRVRRGLQRLRERVEPQLASVGGAVLEELLSRGADAIEVPVPTAGELLAHLGGGVSLPIQTASTLRRAGLITLGGVALSLLSVGAWQVVGPDPAPQDADPARVGAVESGQDPDSGARRTDALGSVLPRTGGDVDRDTARNRTPSVAKKQTRRTKGTPAVHGQLGPAPLENAWVHVLHGGWRVDKTRVATAMILGRPAGGWSLPAPSGELPKQELARADSTYAIPAHGRFTLRLPPGPYVLIAGAHGRKNAVETVTIEQGPARCDLALAPQPIANLPVQVLDESGVALRSAELELWARSEHRDVLIRNKGIARDRLPVRTDPGGRATIQVVPGRYTLRVSKGWRSSESMAVELREGSNPERTFALRAPSRGTLAVEVVDSDGNPVPGARVRVSKARADTLNNPLEDSLRETDSWPWHRTDDLGVARVTRPLGAQVAYARVSKRGGRSKVVALGSRGARVRVVLDRTLVLGGLKLTLTADGRPVDPKQAKHIPVVLTHSQTGARYSADSGLTWNELPTGGYTLSATVWLADPSGALRQYRTTRKRVLRVRPNQTTRLAVDLNTPRGTLRCRVVEPARLPEVQYSHAGGSGSSSGDSLELDGLRSDRTLTLAVWSKGLLPTTFKDLRPGPHTHELKLVTTPSWTVEIVDDQGEPVRGAELTIAGSHHAGWRADSQGQVPLRGKLVPLGVDATGYQRAQLVPPHDRGGTVRVVLQRRATGVGVVRGRVVDQKGQPVAGAKVSCVGPDGRAERERTRGDGTFDLKEAPAGAAVLVAYHGKLGISGLTRVEVLRDGVIDRVVVRYVPSAAVRVTVEGDVTQSMRVRLRGTSPGWKTVLENGLSVRITDGSAELGNWPLGSWELTLIDGRQVLDTRTLELTAEGAAARLRTKP